MITLALHVQISSTKSIQDALLQSTTKCPHPFALVHLPKTCEPRINSPHKWLFRLRKAESVQKNLELIGEMQLRGKKRYSHQDDRV